MRQKLDTVLFASKLLTAASLTFAILGACPPFSLDPSDSSQAVGLAADPFADFHGDDGIFIPDSNARHGDEAIAPWLPGQDELTEPHSYPTEPHRYPIVPSTRLRRLHRPPTPQRTRHGLDYRRIGAVCDGNNQPEHYASYACNSSVGADRAAGNRCVWGGRRGGPRATAYGLRGQAPGVP